MEGRRNEIELEDIELQQEIVNGIMFAMSEPESLNADGNTRLITVSEDGAIKTVQCSIMDIEELAVPESLAEIYNKEYQENAADETLELDEPRKYKEKNITGVRISRRVGPQALSQKYGIPEEVIERCNYRELLMLNAILFKVTSEISTGLMQTDPFSKDHDNRVHAACINALKMIDFSELNCKEPGQFINDQHPLWEQLLALKNDLSDHAAGLDEVLGMKMESLARKIQQLESSHGSKSAIGAHLKLLDACKKVLNDGNMPKGQQLAEINKILNEGIQVKAESSLFKTVGRKARAFGVKLKGSSARLFRSKENITRSSKSTPDFKNKDSEEEISMEEEKKQSRHATPHKKK